jgi:hypothetical protein
LRGLIFKLVLLIQMSAGKFFSLLHDFEKKLYYSYVLFYPAAIEKIFFLGRIIRAGQS